MKQFSVMKAREQEYWVFIETKEQASKLSTTTPIIFKGNYKEYRNFCDNNKHLLKEQA